MKNTFFFKSSLLTIALYIIAKYIDFKLTSKFEIWDLPIAITFYFFIMGLQEGLIKENESFIRFLKCNKCILITIFSTALFYSVFFKRFSSGFNLFLILFYFYLLYYVKKRKV